MTTLHGCMRSQAFSPSVRSAYRLAARLEAMEQNQTGSSSHADGDRPVYQAIWSAAVPPKVKKIWWRLSHEGLATQTNRRTRKLEKDAVCQVCGREEESGYHAVVRCSQAIALRREMRKHWVLPDEHRFEYTGPDWLLHLLGMVSKDEKNNTMFLLWRAWFLRNDIMHGKGKASIRRSVEFLTSYAYSLNLAGQIRPQGISEKGKEKEKVYEGVMQGPHSQEGEKKDEGAQVNWCPPASGWAKLNTDAGFCQHTCMAGIGVVIRDDEGKVILTSWRFLSNVSTAEEAEALACLECVRLSLAWVRRPIEIETGCLELVKALKSEGN
jgi:hypothetical protein